MQYSRVYIFIIDKLEKELPPHFTYHSVGHTKSVIQSAEHLASKERVNGDDLILLLTAALFHDIGFLESKNDHEEQSSKLARKYLPNFDYSPSQIETVCQMILATKLPQKPSNHLAMILCDADLSYVGTDQYQVIAEKLYMELKETGQINNRNQWDKLQYKFLTSHRFFTKTALDEGYKQKEKNLKQLHVMKPPGKPLKKLRFPNFVQDTFLMAFGIISAGFALKGFLVPNNFFDGGVTGISLLLHEFYHFNLAFIIVLANIPLIIMSFFSISKNFALKTFLCVILLGFCLYYFPYPIITSDKLLISIFGGVFLGIGIGLTMRAGCALDGVEVFALYTFKRTSFTITEIIMGINILIFGIAALKFGLETALYSILTYFSASRAIDYVVEGIEAYTGVTIISSRSELIKHRLVNELGRGITIYKGERGFLPGQFESSNDVDIIFTVISRLELRKLKNVVNETDPKAFVFVNTIKEASGGIIKRRKIHHDL
jgi:uncharacterized membrane-anchored protein YitT (DUF2179 family)/predicted metal-dependent HD superfamily phosphohydrolase